VQASSGFLKNRVPFLGNGPEFMVDGHDPFFFKSKDLGGEEGRRSDSVLLMINPVRPVVRRMKLIII